MLGMKRNLSGASTGSPKDLTVRWFSNVYNCLHVDKCMVCSYFKRSL